MENVINQSIHEDLRRYIDHTNLRPDATASDIETLCREATEYGFYAVCVHSGRAALAAKLLAETDVKLAVVVGFPLGAEASEVKAFEAELACRAGAHEIDMVMNVGRLKEGRMDLVKEDIAEVVARAGEYGAIVKVILETCLLTDEEIRIACLIAKEAGAAFVKTSTGFGSTGATAHHVALMRETVGPEIGVKASGGIRDRETALAMLNAGATRIGASSSIKIACQGDGSFGTI